MNIIKFNEALNIQIKNLLWFLSHEVSENCEFGVTGDYSFAGDYAMAGG